MSRWWSRAGAKWELWPEPGGPARSSRGRYAVGCWSTELEPKKVEIERERDREREREGE